MPKVSPNVQWELGEVTLALREKLNGHPSLVVWLTGLSASGKSTLAKAVEQQLFEDGLSVARLDGDNVRHGLCGDLGFSDEDRNENIRRVAEVAAILHELGNVVICAFISPSREQRAYARSVVPANRFLEVYVKCDIGVCKQRDPKGLYAKAERGEIAGFTGVDSAYEEPQKPELVIDTAVLDQDQAASLLLATISDYLSRESVQKPAPMPGGAAAAAATTGARVAARGGAPQGDASGDADQPAGPAGRWQ